MAKKPDKPCAICGNLFAKNPRLSHKQWAAQRYCSVLCRAAGDSKTKMQARPPLEVLFDSSYSPDPESGCWNWTGALSSQGYGTVRWRGTTYRAHMLSLELAGKPRPESMNACHDCDNPKCVNPAHLYWGTQGDNVRDAQERGRLNVGASNHNAKLSPDAVRAIRKSDDTHTALASVFGVTRQAIRAVRAGINWGHVK